MAQPVIQTSFHTGEWAPALNARVDLSKYHSAAALLRNFFVDYRGGASTRMGTAYVLKAYKSATYVRVIPFQASFTVGYMLEFGDFYIRPFYHGAPVLETANVITGATQANPVVVTSAAHGYNNDDWVYITGVVGMTELNGKYYNLWNVTTNTFELQGLDGAFINGSAYTAYVSGGTVQRVYTIESPYAAADLPLVKYAQNVNKMILAHPNYPPQVLTLTAATDWDISAITFGPTLGAPTGLSIVSTLAAGTVYYAYQVTAVDENGSEGPPAITSVASLQDLRTTLGTNFVLWSAVTGAVSYNIYKAELAYSIPVPSGSAFGYIGNVTGTTMTDSNISPDFSQTPSIATNPFAGSGVSNIAITAGGLYFTVPTITIDPPGGSGVTAVAQPVMVPTTIVLIYGGFPYAAGDVIILPGGNTLRVDTATLGTISTFTVLSLGPPVLSFTNPVTQLAPPASGGLGALFAIGYAVGSATIVVPGTDYGSPPNVTFSAGSVTATADATLGTSSAGNPAVPGFFQQRMVLAGPPGAVQTFYMSQPGSYYDFDVSNPTVGDDAITGSIVSGQLNEIKSMVSMPSGLIILSTNAAWQINGGSAGSAVTPINVVANSHAYNGSSDLQPIIANFDILYVQSKGSIVRDLSYNFYANIFTGTDVSVLSSHLFYGYQLTSWAWAEEPFKLVWATRNDGTLLSLAFLKEQELIGWSHHDTNGTFQNVATVIEPISQGNVDAVYLVVQRNVNGNSVQYIERMADRFFSSYVNPWCVDAALQYNSTPATVFSGLEHLIGMTVTGLADGAVIPPTVVSAAGTVTLGTAASTVTIGLAFTPQLQTLQLDTGEPTIQGKRKKITAVTARCASTLGLSMGKTFDTLVPMKDLVLGNVGSQTDEVVTDLVTGDARTVIDPSWDVPGQYCIQQSYPYPATILGVIPEIVPGDTPK